MLIFYCPKTRLFGFLIIIFLSIPIFFVQRALGQINTGAPVITSPVPPSPNAASLGRYGEIPVGLYTGVPGIDIPIYEIKAGGLRLPISVSYHAGGVRVEDIASSVGLGWSLNAGGVITKSVRGLSDDNPNGYFYTWPLINQYLNGTMTNSVQQSFFQEVLEGETDSEQDIYFYNFGEESGKFILDHSGIGISIPQSKYKIEFGTFLGVEDCWKVTNTKGDVAYFTNKEITETTTQNVNGLPVLSGPVTTSWLQTSLTNAGGTENINFTYEDSNISFKTIVSQTKYYYLAGNVARPRPDESGFSNNTVHGKRLTGITFSNGQVDFIKDTQLRSDIPTDYKLQSIVVKSTDLNFYKRFNFYNSYTTSTETAIGAATEERKRLFLDSISVADRNTIKNGTYKFIYNSTQLPYRNSYSQDHWGYFNGANNGANFAPTTIVTKADGNPFNYILANRMVNTSTAQAGILRSITYPLGGRTEFEYENHRAGNIPASLDNAATYLQAKILSDGASTTYTTSFSITAGFGGYAGVNAEIEVWRVGCPNVTTAGCPITLLRRPDGSSVNINSNSTLFLPVGNYSVDVDLTGCSAAAIANYYVRVKWPVSSYETEKFDMLAGGLRIKKMVNYNFDNSVTNSRSYNYNVPDSVGYSSGVMITVPSYKSFVTDFTYTAAGGAPYITATDYIGISSGSRYSLASTRNSAVGYKYVTEFNDDLGVLGKTVSQFSAMMDLYIDVFPFPSPISKEHLRGMEQSKKIYRYNAVSSTYELLRQIKNQYGQLNGATFTSIKVGLDATYSTGYEAFEKPYKIGEYIISTSWNPLIKQTIEDFDPATGSTVQVVNDYEYNNAYQKLKKIVSTSSQGLNKENNTSYSFDMVSTGRDPNGTYQAMVNKNVIDPLIEESEVRNGKTKLQLTNYVQPFTGIFVPGTVEVRNYLAGVNETRIRYHSYDAKGNPLSVSKEDGERVNYRWGHNGQYPIAEVSNAQPLEFYTQSFEDAVIGFNTTVTRDNTKAHSGHYSGKIANTGTSEKVTESVDWLTLTPGAARMFTYSGWVYSDGPSAELLLFMYRAGETGYYTYADNVATSATGKWIYLNKSVRVPSDVVSMRMRVDNNSTGNVWFDDLRIQPMDARSSTFTYDPLVGVTSKTDNKGNTLTYEYDEFQRLINVKDQDGNIIKNHMYHLKN